MGYLNQAAALLGPSLGQPSPPAGAGTISTPPPVPSTEPPQYDVLADPSWKPFVGPQDHAWRNFLNELSPEHRQMLQQKLTAHSAPKGPPPMVMPAAPPPGAMGAGLPISPGL